ncbi:UDP-N-acetylglucosamine 2-epimerase [Coprobacter tertius]|uniref:UDP-N-acetylglucosamine 2-epimerase n=1 Tax=Coprobacter tertius TaxID=2944915 RepID=A0ABT1MD92_9BACT|nr:UDP-N-acetylglucosamine 2-epimerase [Coprobacter tertius]MCP9610600.1 UDP-N-acetylglucosamine 2-epimerase [Coprobacter tertius]
MRKICIVTGTRAEYGLLSRLMRFIEEDVDMQLQIIATNMHLSPEFGLTYREIEKDGFKINKKVEMLLSADTSSSVAKSLGLGIIGFADAYTDLQPDMIIVLGDRYEILGAVSTALLFRIPVAHISGGDVTEGAYDDSIRHAVTKMSHLHFTTTEEYRNRVIQLGENPSRVYNVGSIGLDNIRNMNLLSREAFEESIGFRLGERNLLVTFHPVTLEQHTAADQFSDLLEALDKSGAHIIFTKPNSDSDGRVIISMIDDFVEHHPEKSVSFLSLGYLRYLSALQYVDAVIGNSSSGIVEAPSFGIPTVNIGDRQKGRIRSESVIDCEPDKESIGEAIKKAFSSDFKEVASRAINPYEKNGTVYEILDVIKNTDISSLIPKKFYDLSL